MEETIFQFFEHFSYFGIVIALSFEFVPSELVLPFVGYLVYQGELDFWTAVLAGTIGGVTGPLTLYLLGKYGGRPLISKFGKYVWIKERQLEKADQFFEKYGGIVAFTGRFIPGVRTLISIPCGVAKMNIGLFSLYTFIAMFPITVCYIYLGYTFGTRWREAAAMAERPLLLILFLLIGLFILYMLFRKKPSESLSVAQFLGQRK